MRIIHPNVPTRENRIDSARYMNPHSYNLFPDETFPAGARVVLPVLLERRVLPAGTTSFTISGLDGNRDRFYDIIFDLDVVVSGAEGAFHFIPNGNTIPVRRNMYVAWWEGNGHVGSTVNVNSGGGILYVGHPGWNTGGNLKGKHRFFTRSGENRKGFGEARAVVNPVHHHRMLSNTFWHNSTDNITSLLFTIIAGSFSGTVEIRTEREVLIRQP